MIPQPPINTPFFRPDGKTLEQPWMAWAQEVSRKSVTAHTMTIAKLTVGGANGSITWDANGRVTAYVDPT